MISLISIFLLSGLLITTGVGIITFRLWLVRKRLKLSRNGNTVGIFHPYCNAGGGGERVLWTAVKCLLTTYSNTKVVIYTGETNCSKKDILKNASNTFGIEIDHDKITFIFLKLRRWVEAEKYPYFTLLGQAVGSVALGLEALIRFPPDVFIDTMGYAFTYPIFRYLAKSRVGCYTHYPIISSEMISHVRKRVLSHNNQNYISRNPFLSWLKIIYYRLFAKLYRCAGRSSETILVNSSWTESHILELWQAPLKTHRVFPPCEVSYLKTLVKDKKNEYTIVSIGQFRPEKNHPLQLKAMYELRNLLIKDEETWNRIRLIIVGSCRNDEDLERLRNLQDLSKHLSLEHSVEFRINVTHNDLIGIYKRSDIGLHTMWNEHFGIGVVDCMAAGLIMVAHGSGGPLMDIIETSESSRTGYLAVSASEYAHCILDIIRSSEEENNRIRNAARSSVDRFSEKEFEMNFSRAISSLFKNDLPN